MVSGEKVREWAQILDREATAFSLEPGPGRAKNLLVLCSCVEAAVTGYLISQKMEETQCPKI